MLIVGTDFSASAAGALDEARNLAGDLDVSVEVVHVLQRHISPAWSPDVHERNWLLAADVPETEVTVRLGTVWVELVRIARERSARLIVVGAHGQSGFQPVALGSTAARLALLSPLPILLVGSREHAAEEAVPRTDEYRVSPLWEKHDVPSGRAQRPLKPSTRGEGDEA
jgi:nucleotide-binding universal stress UspA family protein